MFYGVRGLSRNSDALIFRLEELTGCRHLRCGTLWATSYVISACTGFGGRQTRRWCPLCYEGWSEHSYEPLLWEIDLLGCCPIHSCRLEGRCQSCGSYQSQADDIEKRLTCNRCGEPLSKFVTYPMRPRFLWWVDEQIEQLVEFCATPRLSPLPWPMYAEFVGSLRAAAQKAGGLTGEMRLILKDFTRSAWSQAYKPTIRTLVNLCAMQGISMQELLNAPLEVSSPNLFDQWAGLSYVPFPSALQAQRVYAATKCLDDFLSARPSYLPPIELVLRRFKVQFMAVRDAAFDLFEDYKRRQKGRFCGDSFKKLRRAYLYSLCVLKDVGDVSGKFAAGFLKEVSEGAEVEEKYALMAINAAQKVKMTQSDERVRYYCDLLAPQQAVEWLLDRWSRNAHKR